MSLLRVGIVGAGAFGQALYSVYSNNPAVKAILYSRRKDNLKDIANVDYLLLTIPAQDILGFCRTLQGFLSLSTKIVICAKGIDLESGKLLHEVVKERFPNHTILVMSGPNFAHEIVAGLPAITSIASDNLDVARAVAIDLTTTSFKLYPTNDMTTVSLVGALKNVLAIMCGIVRGLELGENFVAAAMTIGIQEVFKLSQLKGGIVKTVFEAACVGDMFLTCSSLTSRNTKYGMLLVKNKLNDSKAETIEGVNTALSLDAHYKDADMPLFKYICSVITKKNNNRSEIIHELKKIVLSQG